MKSVPFLLPKSTAISTVCLGLGLAPLSAQATDYYMITNQPSASGSWTDLSAWNTAADGTGTNPPDSSVFSNAGNTFYTNNRTLRANVAGNFANMVLNTGQINMRTSGGGSTVVNLTVSNSSNLRASTANGRLNVTTMAISSGQTVSLLSDGSNGLLSITNLTGSGNFSVNQNTTASFGLSITSGNSYTGNIGFASLTTTMTLDFNNGFTIGGGLIASNDNGGGLSSNQILLDQDITVGSAVFNGDSLAAGTYSFATLNATYADLFVDGGSGSITVVPEPSVASTLIFGFLSMWLVRRRISTR